MTAQRTVAQAASCSSAFLTATPTLQLLIDGLGIGRYERIPLKGGELEQPRLIFGGAPPFRGELADLGAWNARDEPAFAIDDAGKPVPRDVLGIEEAQEFSLPHDDSEPAKGLAVLEDGNLDIGNPILRERTSQEVGYHYRTR